MPISFDPDWRTSAAGTGDTITPTLPSGPDGDTLVAFIFSTEGLPFAPDGWEWDYGANWDTGGPYTFEINAMHKVREPGDAPEFEFSASCSKTVVVGTFPGTGYVGLGSRNLFIPSTGYDETVSPDPVGVALAGVVVADGSNALDVNYPDANYDDTSQVLTDPPVTSIIARMIAFAWEPGPSTPSFNFEVDVLNKLRWAMFVGRPASATTARWRMRIGWPT